MPDSAATNRKTLVPRTVTRLDTQIPTLPRLLKQQGYHTAHFGKWHLGPAPYSPLEHGFDVDIPHYSGPGPAGGYLAPWSYAPNLQPQQPGEHIDIRLAQEASEWIAEVKDDGPFFLNFWAFSVHSPFDADPATVDYFTQKRTAFHSQRSSVYAAMVKQFDDSVGILLDSLEEQDLLKNTIIIFTSDNGGNMYNVLGTIRATSNFPLRGGKATEFEGGIRVPTVIYWPGITKQAFLSRRPIQSADYYPTILSGLDIPWPSSHIVDGTDIRPLLADEEFGPRPIITFFPSEPPVPDWLPPSATITLNQWKLIRTFYYGVDGGHMYQLFDIDNDIAERHNLAELYPDVVADLDYQLEQHLLNTAAVTPVENPRYVPGSFNDNNIGKQSANWTIPLADPNNLPPVITVTSDSEIVSAGETVSVSYSLSDENSSTSASYRQFMGPEVTLTETGEKEFSFTAPTVYTKQSIGIAFVARDEVQTTSQVWQVTVMPQAIAPVVNLSAQRTTVTKGGSVNFTVEASDENQEHLIFTIESDAVGIDLPEITASGDYSIQVPNNFSGSTLAITVTAIDGEFTTQNSINISVADAPAPASSGGGGTTSVWVLIMVTGLVLYRRRVS
ncbi:sulfatase [Alteromonas lipolytica]|uniref:Sulfatase n=1 Tax=Alteromonas lipolytica TaxID=1856405 RepID=A0A1E8FBG8_9ALTE|nr:sulfatase [Alteromonas lipolytica]